VDWTALVASGACEGEQPPLGTERIDDGAGEQGGGGGGEGEGRVEQRDGGVVQPGLGEDGRDVEVDAVPEMGGAARRGADQELLYSFFP